MIQRAMAGTGVSVESPAMLQERHSGTQREVDLAVRGKMAEVPVVFAIECRDHARPQDVTWIDQLHGKFQDLPIDKVIAVSSSGFTGSARAEAESHGIVCLELREAKNVNWPEYLAGFKTVTIENLVLPHLTHVHLTLGSTSENRDFEPEPTSCTVIDANGQEVGNLRSFVDGIVKSRRFLQAMSDQTSGTCTFEAHISYRPVRFSVCFPDGARHKLLSLDLKGRCGKQRALVSLKQWLYGDTTVAHGELEALGHRFDIAVAKGDSPSERRVALRISRDREKSKRNPRN